MPCTCPDRRPRRSRDLEELVRHVPAAAQPVAVVLALAVLSLLAGDQDDDRTAMALARQAAATADAQGLSAEPMCGIAYVALGRALARQGELAEAEAQLERALEPVGIDSMVGQRAFALLLLAPVRQGRGDLPGARALVDEARELIERFADPGVLPALLEQTEQALASPTRRRVEAAAPLTERELAVLRLLPTRLSNREIGRRAVCLGQHRQEPCPGHLPQARGRHPGRGGHPRPRARPAPRVNGQRPSRRGGERSDTGHRSTRGPPLPAAARPDPAGGRQHDDHPVGDRPGSVGVRHRLGRAGPAGQRRLPGLPDRGPDQRLPGGGLGRAGGAVPHRRWPVRNRRPSARPPGRLPGPGPAARPGRHRPQRVRAGRRPVRRRRLARHRPPDGRAGSAGRRHGAGRGRDPVQRRRRPPPSSPWS